MAAAAAPQKSKPELTIRLGDLRCVIWRNSSENGPRFSAQLKRTYKDKDGKYHDTDSLSGAELLVAAKALEHAYFEVQKLTAAERRGEKEEESE